jgi:5'-nucleotidase
MRTLLLLLLAATSFAADFTVTLLHVNDTHARLEPTIIQGQPYGGMPRLGTLIARHRATDPNPILLHAGDAFQGTFFFNVYEGLADVTFLNALGLDAMAVGNHEFDKGPAALGTFARNARFPLLAANLNVDAEPALRGIIRNSVVVTRGKQRVGIVGGITPELNSISNPGPTVGLRDTAGALQAEVDALTKAGVNKVVLLTHIGYEEEQQLAKTLHNVDVIVGGHSHTLLGNTTAPGWPPSRGAYPTVVDNPDHGKTLVVQSWEGEKVLGRLQVTFDSKGRVKKWGTQQPEIVDKEVLEDPALKAMVEAFTKPLAAQRDRRIGEAQERILQGPALGGRIADAMLRATATHMPVTALMNGGGVRASFEPGAITFGAAISVQPFGNTLVVMDLTGEQLRQAVEDVVEAQSSRVLWVSDGTHYRLEPSQPAGKRVSQFIIAGAPVQPTQTYRIVTNNFLAAGGDGATTLARATGYRYDTGILDIDALVDYLAAHTPLTVAPTRVERVP